MKGLSTGFSLSAEQSRMLADLKAYLDAEFPPERAGISGSSPEWSGGSQFEWALQFNAQLARDGWLIPHWPSEYGGRGLGVVENMLIREELAYRRVPIANANGLDMLAPILLRFGTQAQKDEHLPKIARMERLWCQGYSEPDAGSDLASVRTMARLDGDHYVINGSKIWTGHAQNAHWMVLLARTDPGSMGTRGLSLLLVDLENTPGVTVHPIGSLTGAVTFCQEFFQDCPVPAGNLLGPEHGGWAASRALLEHERAPFGQAAKYRRQLDDLLEAAAGRQISPEAASKLGRLVERVESARSMTYALAQSFSDDGTPKYPPHMPSVVKVFGSELAVELTGMACEILGLDITTYQPPEGSWDFWQEFLYSLIYRIGGGTNEIQREIIALRRFGLART